VAADHVGAQRAELNEINVFPVPDGDTGTNLTLTLRAIADAVRPLNHASVSHVAEVAAEAGVLGARGNSGMLISHFLVAFARGLGDTDRAGTDEIADAIASAARSLEDVLERPVEGTILTVARDLAAEGSQRAGRVDLYDWLRHVQRAGQRSLQRTRRILPALREAGVVDAGAKGFIGMWEGVLRYVEGKAPLRAGRTTEERPPEAPLLTARAAGVGESEGRYCTQIALRSPAPLETAALRHNLAPFGTSLIVLQAGTLVKVHIHSDRPEAVRDLLSGFGEVVSERIEDTRKAHGSCRVAIITDSSSDLPPAAAERCGVAVVPILVNVGERSYRDGVDLDAEGLRTLLADATLPHPTTSQPAPADFNAAIEKALARTEEPELLAVFMSSRLSGTFGTGAAALRGRSDCQYEVVDSRSASLGLGLLVIRAAELIEEGVSLPEVARELERVRNRSGILFTVESLEGLRRSGRIGRGSAWIGDLLDIRPILEIDTSGRIVTRARVRGKEAVIDAVLHVLTEELATARRYRLGVVHFGAPQVAERISRELEARFAPIEIVTGQITAALANHLGTGTWGVAYQIEDTVDGR